MIEATCTACGTVNRISDADVPAGTKFVACASCKSRVAIPAKGAVARPGAPRGEALDFADLPAPRRASALGGESAKPAPRSGLAAASAEPELPAPRTKRPVAPPGPGGLDLDDILPDAGADLPAPRAGGARAASPDPRGGGGADLPAPKGAIPSGKARAVTDLPIPGIADTSPLVDLPSPKPKAGPGITDLPAPRPKVPPGLGAAIPKVPPPPPVKGITDLPAPKPQAQGITDLPGPKVKPVTPVAPPPMAAKPGAIVDLPMPKPGVTDLPMPKPGQPGDLPAPKGFFEDLPQPARNQPQTTDVAPKGFFDDLPKPSASRSGVQTPGGNQSQSGIELDLGDASALELEESEPAPPVRMKAPSAAPPPTAGPSNQFDDLDLSAPSPVSFQKASGGGFATSPSPQVATITATAAAAAQAVAHPRTPMLPVGGPARGEEAPLELEEPRQGGGIVAPTSKLSPRERAEERKRAAAAAKVQKGKGRKWVMVVLLGVVALGGGGFFVYQRHAKAQEHQNQINEQLGAARRALVGAQWQRASTAAQQTLDMDKNNPEALGIRAEALFALGISEGGNTPRFAAGRKTLADALEAGVSHPALERAQALSPISAGQGDKAVTKLKALAAKAPKDASLQLYLGWAYATHGDFDDAIKAFDTAAASAPLKVHALYARAHAKQEKGDIEGARADYTAVLEIQKDHLGAQLGLASTLPASQSQQAEADLLAILAIKDIEKKDPRGATQAWILAAEIARKSGRLDVARERFRKALAIQAGDVRALTGLAEVELRDGKLELAAETIAKALAQNPDDMSAQLVATEIAIAQKKLDDAAKRIDLLKKRTPPPPVVEQAQLMGLSARLLEAQGKEQDAIDAYLEAAKLAGDLDLTPTLTAAAKLTQFADKAAAGHDDARASELRKKADALLGALSESAEKDPNLALTLGMAYISMGDAAKGETWLRKVTEQKPKDVDAHYQLAKALSKLGKNDEAIGHLRIAVDLDPTRSEIGLELARTYETADPPRISDAEKLYDKLLAAKDPPIVLRARAGKFYARIGQMAKAGEQGTKILAEQEDNPAGLYLKGEGLLKEGKTDAARKLFVQASDADQSEPQFADARGRAAEQWAKESGNSSYQDDALRAYDKAVKADPTYFASWVGQGRLYVLRHEDQKAIPPLQSAWKLKETAEVARLMGIAAKQMSDPKGAVPWLEKSLAMQDDPEAAFTLGTVYTDPVVNNPKGAISALDKAVRLAEKQEKETGTQVAWLPDALYQLGDILRSENNLHAAKQAWEKWLAKNPKPSAKRKNVEQLLLTELKDQ